MALIPSPFPLAVLPTPLVRAHRLEEALGCGPVLVKRDDLIGFSCAGNKARPLEYLLGAAYADGCDVLVTGGGPGSNFCQAAAVAARTAGLDCVLVVPGASPAVLSPNLAMARACGARLHFTGEDREFVDAAVAAVASDLAAEGRRPLPLPRGGSTPLGAMGFAMAARELAGQLDTLGMEPEAIVVATGSGGTQAGLLAGLTGLAKRWRLIGASVSRPVDEITARVLDIARGCARQHGSWELPRPEDVEVVDARGPGFGIPSADDVRFARLAMETEGLVLDATYTAKSFRVTAELLQSGAPGPVVFWHTGGLVPAVAAFTQVRNT
ncbi:pyridoxal-phosphate dependent enzyme [Streptomyces sp. NPDC005708]|uniref:1-aminocyclopropane-1-carboxylate deaminase/D-cysteine desulfhydrase n=1 Tax=Streptomyces sp. NPDC005708 TaxID=3154564 RepID=UPI0033EDE5E5